MTSSWRTRNVLSSVALMLLMSSQGSLADPTFPQFCVNNYVGIPQSQINPTPLEAFNVAQLIHGPDDGPDILATGKEGSFDPQLPATPEYQWTLNPLTTVVWSGMQTVLNRLQAQRGGNKLYLANGKQMSLSITYYNIGSLNNRAANFSGLNPNLSVRTSRIVNLISNGNYPIIVSPVLSDLSVYDIVSQACENGGHCVHVVPYQASPWALVCPPFPGLANCAGRPSGARRFQSALGLFAEVTSAWSGMVTLMDLLGVKTAAIIATGSTPPDKVTIGALTPVFQAGNIGLVYTNTDAFSSPSTLANGSLTPAQVTNLVAGLKQANPDFVVVTGQTGYAANQQNYIAILDEWKRQNYVPKGAVVTGTLDIDIVQIEGARAQDDFFSLTLWNSALRGDSYTVTDATDLFPSANVGGNWIDAPQVFWDYYVTQFGPGSSNHGSVPFSFGVNQQNFANLGAFTFQSVIRLIETAYGLTSQSALLSAAQSIQVNSFGGSISFDQVGKRPAYAYPVVQHQRKVDKSGINPPLVFPTYSQPNIIYPMTSYHQGSVSQVVDDLTNSLAALNNGAISALSNSDLIEVQKLILDAEYRLHKEDKQRLLN